MANIDVYTDKLIQKGVIKKNTKYLFITPFCMCAVSIHFTK